MYEAIEHYKVYKQRQDELQQAKQLFEECGFQYKEKAKQEMDKFLNKLIVKNGVTNIQYVKETRKQMGRSNNGDINHNNDNNKIDMSGKGKLVGWVVVLAMWTGVGVSMNMMNENNSCHDVSECNSCQEIVNTTEDIIEWIVEDEASGNIGRDQADTYINNLEGIIINLGVTR